MWGNVTHKYGWGGEVQGGSAGQSSDIYSYSGNRRNGFSYDASGNLTNDLGQTFSYDATGQQATAAYTGYLLQQSYDGDGLRVKKDDNHTFTYYLRSSVLGGQVVAEIMESGELQRSYTYLGGQLLALRNPNGKGSEVYWIHEDPITKSKRVTKSNGVIVSTIELDPWGADTNRSNNAAFQPKQFTSYERDSNGSDEAMFRRSNRWHSRFDQPDPYDGSYDAADPQSFNRYAYVQNDPVNFVDPSGLMMDLIIFGPHGELLGYSWGGDPASDFGGSDRGFFVNGERQSSRIPGYIIFGVYFEDRIGYGFQLFFGIGAPGGYMHGESSRGGGGWQQKRSGYQPLKRGESGDNGKLLACLRIAFKAARQAEQQNAQNNQITIRPNATSIVSAGLGLIGGALFTKSPFGAVAGAAVVGVLKDVVVANAVRGARRAYHFINIGDDLQQKVNRCHQENGGHGSVDSVRDALILYGDELYK